MKKLFLVVFAITLLMCGGCKKKETNDNTTALKGTISISGAWALYPLTVTWADEFRKLHPALRIDISAGGAGKGIVDVLSGVVDIGMVSREIFPVEIEKGAWWVSIAKDAVVPMFNEKNPYLEEILRKGISQNEFRDIWINEKVKSWNEITGKLDTNIIDKNIINVYTRSDACGAAQTWAQFLGGNQDDLTGIGVYGDPGLAEAVKKDIFGIGFNNVNYAYDSKTRNTVSGLKIIPVDLNANNIIDPDENFYANRDAIIQAISDGKYPSPPSRLLHFVCRGRPEKLIVNEFLRWALTKGQEFVVETGYIPVEKDEIEKGIKKLDE
ncbi:MAG: PstS family phosphate ABC transporter substrate-binding protein [Spirochaetales bacterium]|nr:PstS family phosphate ABC transporter substrate-binding protein [Spirochaetales bacterium]